MNTPSMNTPTINSPTINTPTISSPTFPSNSFNSFNYNSLCLNQSLTNIASQEPVLIDDIDQKEYEQYEQYEQYIYNAYETYHNTIDSDSYQSSSTNKANTYDIDELYCIVDNSIILQEQSDNIILQKHGYQKIRKLSDTKQGQLLLGFKISDISNGKIPPKVAIKKISRKLHFDQISINGDMSFITHENVVKEASILHFLTVENKFTEYICQYMDFFSSETDFYLITKYIEGETNLTQFVKKCHQFIKEKQLSIAAYQKMTKFLFWQIIVMVEWMHNTHSICHLDLTIDNIMIADGDFIISKEDNSVTINPKISIRICDFGLSERFKMDEFQCAKYELSDASQYTSPQVFFEEIYDPRKADIYSLGILLYQMTFNFCPYTYQNKNDIWYKAIMDKNMLKLLQNNKLLKYIRPSALDLIENCLQINENKRYNAMDVIQHKSLENYYNKYKKRMQQTKLAQKKKLHIKPKKSQNCNMDSVPYYCGLQQI